LNVSPAGGEMAVPLTPTLESSAFSDQDAQSTHAASQWQVRTNAGSYNSPVYDSGETAGNLTQITLPAALPGPGAYWWQVRHQDDSGRWSAYSDESSFATVGCSTNEQCSDGLWCNGSETCVAGQCQAGTAPDCSDGIPCTTDSCNETLDQCAHAPNDAACSDGLWCNGAETCNLSTSCQAGTAPNCNDGIPCTTDSCSETLDQCDHAPNDGACSDGLWCNGAETCSVSNGCQPGANPCPDDGLFCDGTESCDEGGNLCLHSGDPCDDQESCTANNCNEAENLCEFPCGAENSRDPCCADPVCEQSPRCSGKAMPWLNLLLN